MSASAMYKQYTKRAEANGKQPLDFDTWKSRYLNRAPRGTRKGNSTTKTAVQIAAQSQPESNGNGSGEPSVDAIVAAVLKAMGRDQEASQAPSQPDAEVQPQETKQSFEIRDPESQATGRQLWKLMNLGLIDFISKGEASQLIDNASK